MIGSTFFPWSSFHITINVIHHLVTFHFSQTMDDTLGSIPWQWAWWIIRLLKILLKNIWHLKQFDLTIVKGLKKYKEQTNHHYNQQPNYKIRVQVWVLCQDLWSTRPSKKINYQQLGLFPFIGQIILVEFWIQLSIFEF
jgi:hypothetical protein